MCVYLVYKRYNPLRVVTNPGHHKQLPVAKSAQHRVQAGMIWMLDIGRRPDLEIGVAPIDRSSPWQSQWLSFRMGDSISVVVSMAFLMVIIDDS